MFATTNEATAFSLRASKLFVHKFLDGLTPAEFEHQPAPGANCAAWIVGHLALTDRRVLAGLGVTDLPPLPDGFEAKFSPTKAKAAEQTGYGDPKELIALFDVHRDRLIAAALVADPAKLAEAVPSASGAFADRGEAVLFMGLHTMLHMGQVSTIRRSLGHPPGF